MTIKVTVGEYDININENEEYQVFDETITGKKLSRISFVHIKDWLHQKILKQEIEVWNRVPLMFNNSVYRSLLIKEDASPYWGLDPTDQMKVFKREKYKDENEKEKRRSMAKDVDLSSQSIRTKRYRLANLLEAKGYDRDTAQKAIDSLIEEKGSGLMVLRNPDIIRMVDDMML